MPEAKAKEVTKKEETALVKGAVSFEDDAGGGFEEADRESYAIPFVRILQKLSPQLDETSGEYIEEAKAGMFFNTVTEDTYDGKVGLEVIPCHFRRVFVEWNKREDGGGFVAEYDVAEGAKLMKKCVRDDRNRDITPDGTQLVDTRIHYVQTIDPNTGALQPAVITMSATQAKKSKRWMTVMQNLLKERKDGTLYNPAMFASVFKLISVPESNDQGSWHGYRIPHVRFLDESSAEDQRYYQTARAFRDAVKAGLAEVHHDLDDVGISAGSGSSDANDRTYDHGEQTGDNSFDDDIPGF